MSRLLAIFRRELMAQFLSPVSWGLLTLIWIIWGIFFRFSILENPTAYGDIMRMLWEGGLLALWLQLLLAPLQTMRLISEEKRSGTFEMLVTTPARDHEIVIGKFLGALTFNSVAWLVIPVYALIIQRSGGQPDPGPVWVSYAAVVASGALYLSIGLMASALTQHQILAGFLGIVLVLLVGVAPRLWTTIPDDWPVMREILRSGDVQNQMEQAARGLLDVVHFTYKLVGAALFLLFTVRILEVRKWA